MAIGHPMQRFWRDVAANLYGISSMALTLRPSLVSGIVRVS
jgi:hypothetical protein